jgi:hypothetical protein
MSKTRFSDHKSEIIYLAEVLGIAGSEDEIMDSFCKASELYRLCPLPPEYPEGWIYGLDVFCRWNLEPSFGLWEALGVPHQTPFLWTLKKGHSSPLDLCFSYRSTPKREQESRTDNFLAIPGYSSLAFGGSS